MRSRRYVTGWAARLGLLGLSVWPWPGLAAGSQAPLLLAPVSAPASLPGIGKELQRAMVQALHEANVSAQPATSDSESTLSAKLEEVGAGRLKLSLTHRSGARAVRADAMGDLEHLDDLVYSVVAELRPRLLSSSDPSPVPQRSLTSPQLAGAAPVAVKLASLSGVSRRSELALLGPKPEAKPEAKGEAKLSGKSEAKGEAKPEANLSGKPEAKPEAKGEAKPGSSPSPVGSTLPPPPTVTGPIPAPVDALPKQRPRVAVGLLGEPVAGLPTGYYGLGSIGQHALMSFLQQRLQVPVTATRLYSLVGGYEALEQSLRAGAHHTLMARLDALAVQNGVLSGRIHLVLLQDGKLLYDRSVQLIPTVSTAGEVPSSLFSRALSATLDTLLADLSTRLPPR